MSANLRFEGNFPELVKDLFTSNVTLSTEHSDEIFDIFGGIVFDVVAFLLLIRLISFNTSAFVTSLKENKFGETFSPILFLINRMLERNSIFFIALLTWSFIFSIFSIIYLFS